MESERMEAKDLDGKTLEIGDIVIAQDGEILSKMELLRFCDVTVKFQRLGAHAYTRYIRYEHTAVKVYKI